MIDIIDIIDVIGLSKKYGGAAVLDNLNFKIRKGEIFGLVGPNGAGKSTFISILTSVIKPTSGDIIINGYSIRQYAGKVKKSIGYVPQEIALYPGLTGLDNLRFWAGVYGLGGRLKKDRMDEALSIAGLAEKACERVDRYSGGMKRRLNIAVALLHHPEILVMDEPMVGVDMQSRMYILDAIKELKESGRTIIFASHYADEMKKLCDRIAVLDRGAVRAIGTLSQLRRQTGREDIEEIIMEIIGRNPLPDKVGG